jgi:hypothetical protein
MEEKKKVTQIEEKPKKQTTAKNSAVEVVVMGIDGAKKSTKSLPEGIFNVPVSDRLLAQYVRVYLTNQRQGTRKVKSRGEIASSTRKETITFTFSTLPNFEKSLNDIFIVFDILSVKSTIASSSDITFLTKAFGKFSTFGNIANTFLKTAHKKSNENLLSGAKNTIVFFV